MYNFPNLGSLLLMLFFPNDLLFRLRHVVFLGILIGFHHFFHRLVFLLAFLRYGEEVWPEEPWLLPSCPRYCYSYSFLCLVLAISFHSTKTLLLEHIYSCFLSLLLTPLKLPWRYSLWHVNAAFLNSCWNPRQSCSSWDSDHAETFAVVLSAVVARQAQLLAAGCGNPFCTCHLLLELSGCSRFPFKNKEDKMILDSALQMWIPLQDAIAWWLIRQASFCFTFK